MGANTSLKASTNVETSNPLEDQSFKVHIIGGEENSHEPISSKSSMMVCEETSHEHHPTKILRLEFDASYLVKDLGLQKQIWDCPSADREKIQFSYLKFGPYKPKTPKVTLFLEMRKVRPL